MIPTRPCWDISCRLEADLKSNLFKQRLGDGIYFSGTNVSRALSQFHRKRGTLVRVANRCRRVGGLLARRHHCVFEVWLASGDKVTFKPSQPTHSCLSTPGMIPDGAEGWRGQIGKSVSVTFAKPGYYGYHCLPHRSLGMVGLVIVEGEGHDANVAAVKTVKQPGKAARVREDIWREVGM